MIKRIKETIRQLNTSIFVGEKLQSTINAMSYVGLAIAFCTLITTVMNLFQGTYFMAATTGFFCLVGIFTFVTCHYYNLRLPSTYAILFSCIILMTYYAVTGANQGFAILWTMIVPSGVMILGGVKLGILLSLYYWLLFVVLFYTPLRSLVAAQYTVTFMNRYPVIYLCAILINSTAMIRYHISVLNDMEYNKKLTSEVQRLTAAETQRRKQLEHMSLLMIVTLANAIDAKDKYTNGHSYRVSEYAVLLAKKLGWDEERIQSLRYEALLHDVGKIGIPDAVLNKDSRLSDTEFKIIQFHAFLGGEILSEATTIPGAQNVAKYHHERVDGKGYPDGLTGEQIPENARIVCIADSFDAMNSDRVYRKALPRQIILQELRKGRGTQFDPKYLDAFLELYESGELTIPANPVTEEKKPMFSSEDVHKIVQQFDSNFDYTGETEFSGEITEKTYEYIHNLHQGLRIKCTIVILKIRPAPSADMDSSHFEKAIAFMNTAIKRTIPDDQVCVRCSKTQIMLLLTEDGLQIHRIMQSLYVNFYKLTDGSAFELSYEVFPPIEASP